METLRKDEGEKWMAEPHCALRGRRCPRSAAPSSLEAFRKPSLEAFRKPVSNRFTLDLADETRLSWRKPHELKTRFRFEIACVAAGQPAF